MELQQPAIIRILHLDDNPADKDLVDIELRRRGLPCEIEFVQTEAQFRSSLSAREFDIILSDYKIPQFDGDRAFAIASLQCPETPFIFVTGEVGEEFVIDRMKRGVTDYVLKDNLRRLAPAISRALAERDLRRNQRLIVDRYRRLVDLSPDAIAVHCEGIIVFVNPAALKMFGASKPDDLIGKPIDSFIHPAFKDVVAERIRNVIGGAVSVPLIREKMLRLDGVTIDVEVAAGQFEYEGKPATQVVVRDITERVAVEEQLRHSEDKFAKAFHGNAAAMAITRMRDGMFIDVNERWLEMIGYSREEVLGKSTIEIGMWADPADRARFIAELERTGHYCCKECRFVRKSKEEWIALFSADVAILEGEKVLINSMVDLTQRT